MAITDDMTRYIAAHFKAEERSAASNLVAAAIIHDGTPASHRLMRCALVAASGSLERLAYFVELLRIDWRDVIMAGEYEYHGAEPIRVRDLNLPLP